ncbi:Uncharacterised protein [uncultured archaeon]|nr:Uncharacterised protein [uncultured archaeon]
MGKDIRNTEIARAIEAYFDATAQGNEGDSEIELLELEGSALKYKIKVRHRQTQKIRIPGDGKKTIVIYSLTENVEGIIDVLHPDPKDLKVCFNSPVGKLCVNLDDLIKIIAAAI